MVDILLTPLAHISLQLLERLQYLSQLEVGQQGQDTVEKRETYKAYLVHNLYIVIHIVERKGKASMGLEVTLHKIILIFLLVLKDCILD